MDINAGRYLEGETMAALTAENFELVIATASGKRTKGEHAGHSQVSLWRNWRQTDNSHLAELRARTLPDGKPLNAGRTFDPTQGGASTCPTPTERVGLVLPTSLCAAQISRLAAERLNAKGVGRDQGLSRFVALTHTEGCGFGGAAMYDLLHRTYRGYLTHPNVAAALLLEHGCEKVPNDVMRKHLADAELASDRFGWASVQLDGGIERALEKIEAWFQQKLAAQPPAPVAIAPDALTIGLMTTGAVAPETGAALAVVAEEMLERGGSIVIPESDPLLADGRFAGAVLGAAARHATLAYGQPIAQPGFHVVATESDHWVENLTGLGGCGAQLVVAVVSDHARQGHPLLPVIQVAEPAQRGQLPADDIDQFLAGHAAADQATLRRLIDEVARRQLVPVANAQGFVDFQLTRGLLGVTT
jgi:altronate dehydratase